MYLHLDTRSRAVLFYCTCFVCAVPAFSCPAVTCGASLWGYCQIQLCKFIYRSEDIMSRDCLKSTKCGIEITYQLQNFNLYVLMSILQFKEVHQSSRYLQKNLPGPQSLSEVDPAGEKPPSGQLVQDSAPSPL